MNRQQLQGLGALNAYQIAGIAFATSAVVAVGTLIVLRRTILRRPEPAAAGRPGRAYPSPPGHFSENLIIPGFTQTGEEIADQDADAGQSAEGV